MKKVPIVFAFDNNIVLPACICIASLLENSKADTFYHIYILYPDATGIDKDKVERLKEKYANFELQFIPVDNQFDNAFEIRGITTPAYYRLLIPELIPEWDKILYSDVDVIFRSDLSDIYFNTDLDNCYMAGVNAPSGLNPAGNEYYEKFLNIDPNKIICSGNLIINSKLINEDNLVHTFKKLALNDYKFQDMDIINIACKDRIMYLPPWYCLTTNFTGYAIYKRDTLLKYYSEAEIQEALTTGIVHYNGAKPWKSYCPNMDIWWEYYRNSIYFDQKYYYDFYNNKLDELDRLPLMKRIKILARYFIHGQTK